MQWILRKLGLLKTNQQDNPIGKPLLSCDLLPGCLRCQWKLKQEDLNTVIKEADSLLTLRIRDVPSNSNDAIIATAMAIETSVYKNEATINLPTKSGMILVELGYKDRDGIYIILECEALDLGPRILIQQEQQDWFPVQYEETSIHQIMYEMATKNSALGGSERINS